MLHSYSTIVVLCVCFLIGCTTTPLYLLATQEYSQELQAKLERGLDPNTVDESGHSLLSLVVEVGNIESVDLLLQYGADPLLRSERDRKSPLYAAILLRETDITKLLLAAAVESGSITPSNSVIAICAATVTSSANLLGETLFEKRHVNTECPDNLSPLYHVLVNKDSFGLNFLMRFGVDVDSVNIFDKHTALTWSIRHQDYDSFQQLLAIGADPNKEESQRTTPLDLSLAILGENSSFSEVLLFSGADSSRLSFESAAYALHEKNIDILISLLDFGANPDLHSKQGETLLFRAIANDCLGCAEALLEHEALPNPPNSVNNYSPLVLSISKGYIGLTDALLAAGANANVPHEGIYPIDMAELVLLEDQYFRRLIEKAGVPSRKTEGLSVNLSRANYTRYGLERLKFLSAGAYAKGRWDGSATKALRNFQLHMGLPAHGYPSTTTINALDAALAREYQNQFLLDCAGGEFKKVKKSLAEDSNLLQVQDVNRWTCLMHAIFKGHPNTSMYLINTGADVNHRGVDGVTPLFLAVGAKMEKEKQKKLIRLLSAKGASPNLKNKKGWAANDIASTRGGWIADELDVRHIERADNFNVAVLSKRKAPMVAMWRCAREFPSDGVKEDWDQGRRIVSVQEMSGVWCVLSGKTKHKNGGAQTYKLFNSGEYEKITKQNTKWEEEGYTISGVTKNRNKIVFVATEPQDQVDSAVAFNPAEWAEIKNTISRIWDNGYKLVSVIQLTEKYWMVHSAKYTGYRSQTWFSAVDFPSKKIQRHWKEGREITSLTYSALSNRWFVIMSSGTGIEDQRLAVGDFKQLYSQVKDYGAQGWELSNLAGHQLD